MFIKHTLNESGYAEFVDKFDLIHHYVLIGS